MKEEYKSKMIYCHNKECKYCDDVTGWCILSTWEEFESTCPIKDEIIKNIDKYIVKDKNDVEVRTRDLKDWFSNLSFKEKVWCYNFFKEEYEE